MDDIFNLDELPEKPGCYFFKNKKDIILYIGKAKNLKKRVKSYFQKKEHDSKTHSLLKSVEKIDFIVTDNELESLILENNLIKKHFPKYNIDLKDSKRYSYIEITDEKFPRLLISRKKEGKGEFFGPFVSAGNRDHILRLLKRSFKIRTCKKFPKKACLRYNIGLCSAPCIGEIKEDEYENRIKDIKSILKGKTEDITNDLKLRMKKESIKKNYEKAIELREQINAIRDLSERQRMERSKKFDEDIINYIIKNDKIYLMIFNIYKGTLINKQEFIFDYNPDFFEEFLIQYYSENVIPKEIILPLEVDNSIKLFLEREKSSKIILTNPKIGEKNDLLKLVLKNIEISFFSNIEKLEDLKIKLNLQDTPYVIECFDISHLSGTNMVASMVQFRNGQPDKSNYRRFKIKTVDGIDDTRAISEVVRRRYYRLINENKNFPDLILIDGGKAQLNFALKELENFKLKIPIIALAKRLEEIYIPGNSEPISLPKKSQAIKILQQIRDEAHRFAITYNRFLRNKEIKDGF